MLVSPADLPDAYIRGLCRRGLCRPDNQNNKNQVSDVRSSSLTCWVEMSFQRKSTSISLGRKDRSLISNSVQVSGTRIMVLGKEGGFDKRRERLLQRTDGTCIKSP